MSNVKGNFDYNPYNQEGRIHSYLAGRPKEAGELLVLIMSASKETKESMKFKDSGELITKSDLGYCVVSFDAKNVNPYRIIEKDSGKYHNCDDLSHVLEVILRKWW